MTSCDRLTQQAHQRTGTGKSSPLVKLIIHQEDHYDKQIDSELYLLDEKNCQSHITTMTKRGHHHLLHDVTDFAELCNKSFHLIALLSPPVFYPDPLGNVDPCGDVDH